MSAAPPAVPESRMHFVRWIELDCPPAVAIEHVRKPRLFEYVAAPWVRVEPVDPAKLPEEWEPGRYLVRMRLFGRIPLGHQWIGIRIEQRGDRLLVHDHGNGDRVRVWDHRIEITPSPAGGTRYCDRVTIDAGWRTPFVGWFARRFFAHRQRRWRRLVRTKFDYDA